MVFSFSSSNNIGEIISHSINPRLNQEKIGEILLLIEKILSDQQVNIDAAMDELSGDSPLLFSIRYNIFVVVNLLMKHNANIYKKIGGRSSPLRFALNKVTHKNDHPFTFGALNFRFYPKDPESNNNKKPPIEYYDCFNALIYKNNVKIYKWLYR